MSGPTFEDLQLYPWLIRQCKSIGIKSPTPIQAQCIPEILNGKDCIGASKTGSGKTLAFVLPILQKLCEDPYGIFALVLTPTRELAYQIADQFSIIGKPMNLRHCVIVGRMDWVTQGHELARRPHIVIATPGRLSDHIESCNTFSFKNLRFLVVDEADRLLGGHFNDQIKTIFENLPKKRQDLYFSATITDTLETLKGVMNQKGREVFLYGTCTESTTVEGLEQYYVVCPKYVKDAYFVETIRTFRENNENGSIMIFTDSCSNCQVLSMTLNTVGFENTALHGMMKQQERLSALNNFKSHRVKILIATDVASRGLDIPTVELVINHDVPKIPKEYIHRVGRTARAGKKGQSVTLITPHEVPLLLAIEKHIGDIKMTEYKLDDYKVAEIFAQISLTKCDAKLQLDEENFFEKKLINLKKKWILEGLDPDREEKKYFRKIRKGHKKKQNEKMSNRAKEEIVKEIKKKRIMKTDVEKTT